MENGQISKNKIKKNLIETKIKAVEKLGGFKTQMDRDKKKRVLKIFIQTLRPGIVLLELYEVLHFISPLLIHYLQNNVQAQLNSRFKMIVGYRFLISYHEVLKKYNVAIYCRI